MTWTRSWSGGVKRQDGRADIAADLDVDSRMSKKMRDERGSGRFAIGAGDRDEGRAARDFAAFAAEQLDVADDFDARLARLEDGPVRRGMRQRNAGRKDERGEGAPVGAGEILDPQSRRARLLPRVLIVVPDIYARAARDESLRGDEAGAAQAEDRDGLAREDA